MPLIPLNHHYAMENPASIFDEEAMTALELAGRTTAKVNETVEAFNKLETDTNEHLRQQDDKLVKQEAVIIPREVAERQQELINNGTFNNAIGLYSGNLEARVDSLLASVPEGGTTMDAEVIDIRTDANGTTHASAGVAVRNITKHLLDSKDRNMYGEYLVYYHWEQGGYDISTGTKTNATDRIRASASKSAKLFKGITFSVPAGIEVGLVYYYNPTDAKPAGELTMEWVTPNVLTEIDQTAGTVRPIARKIDGSDITPAEAVAFQCRVLMDTGAGDFLPNLKKVMCHEHIAVDDTDIEVTTVASGDTVWFVNGVNEENKVNTLIPAGSFIRRLTIPTVPLNKKTAKVGIWYKVGNTITLVNYKTVSNINGTFTIDLNHYAKHDALVSVESDDRIFYYKGSVTGRYMFASYAVGSTTLDYTQKSQFNIFRNMTLGAKLTYDTISFDAPTVLEVGPGHQFAEIRDAVESIDDNGSYTILVYPRELPYKNFSMIRKLSTGEVYPWTGSAVRNISIIGMDRIKCVVESKTGDYYDPPCEALCNGTIRNLTFRATHTAQSSDATQGGYAVHIDCQTLNDVGYEMRFENCVFISTHGPGAGIGLHKDCDLTFQNCEFYADGDPAYMPYEGYTNIVNYGGIFCHSSTEENITGQHLTLDNCRVVTQKTNKVLWLTESGANSDFTVTALRNILYGHASGCVKVSKETQVKVDPISFGNNADEING